MGLSLKLCTDIINYKCNKPKLSRQQCWRRTGPATPCCPKAHLTLRPLSSSGSCCCLDQKLLSMEWCLRIFSSPPLVCPQLLPTGDGPVALHGFLWWRCRLAPSSPAWRSM